VACGHFFVGLYTGAGLAGDDPVLLLRHKIMGAKLEGNPLPPKTRVALMVKAWNMRRGGASGPLVMRKGEVVPRLMGCQLAGSLRRGDAGMWASGWKQQLGHGSGGI
jgi:hypothetical protein